MIDWRDAKRDYEIHVMQVDPNNLDIERGELENLILSGCSISSGYYTDTRISAKLQTLGSNYIDGSWLRIRLISGDYTSDMGTFVLQDDPSYEEKSGGTIYSYELQSVLWGLSEDLCFGHFAIGTMAYSEDVFERICKTCCKTYIINAGANNYRYAASKVYDASVSYLSILFDVCDASGNRLDVDGHGRITMSQHLTPSQITPAWTIDADDPRTLLLAAGISTSSSTHDIPGRVIVVYTNGDTEIIASADLDSTSPYSSQRRGYMITKNYNVSSLDSETHECADTLAQTYLAAYESSTTTKASFLYFPCKCGETLTLIRDGESKKYLIQSIDPINLGDMTMEIELKEVS